MGMEAGPRPPPRQDGGILVILGMPPGAEVGIDLQPYRVGPEFKGIAGIPLGRLHLVTYGTGQGLKQGFWLRFARPREVCVKCWDPAQEELVEEGTGLPEGSMGSLLAALQRGELNRHLGAYPEAEQGRLWRNLTNCVDEGTLARSGLKLGQRVLAGEWEEEKLPRAGVGTGPHDGGAVVPYFAGVGRAAQFTDVPGARKPGHRAMTPEELTRYHLDRSERLGVLLSGAYGGGAGAWRGLLGEYQLAFVLFLNLYSMAGLRHWKEATALLCHCGREALGEHTELFAAFVRVLFTQVKTIPEDFFVEEDQLSRGNFLQPCLRALVRNVRDFYHGSRGQEEGGEGRSESGQQQPLVVDGGEEEAEEDQDQDQEEDVMAMGPGSGSGGTSSSGSDADKARELARYVDRFAALMERRFRALVLGRATAAPKAVPKADVGVVDGGGEEEDEEDGEGPVVVPWEEVARALGEIEAEGGVAAGGGGRELSTIAEEDVKE